MGWRRPLHATCTDNICANRIDSLVIVREDDGGSSFGLCMGKMYACGDRTGSEATDGLEGGRRTEAANERVSGCSP